MRGSRDWSWMRAAARLAGWSLIVGFPFRADQHVLYPGHVVGFPFRADQHVLYPGHVVVGGDAPVEDGFPVRCDDSGVADEVADFGFVFADGGGPDAGSVAGGNPCVVEVGGDGCDFAADGFWPAGGGFGSHASPSRRRMPWMISSLVHRW